MSIKEKIKEMFKRSKERRAKANSHLAEEKEKLIKLYNELEKEGYLFSMNRKFLGTFMNRGDSFGGYESTAILFKDGVLVIESYDEKEFTASHIEKEKSFYNFVKKEENGKFTVYQNVDVQFREVPNIDMRCVDSHVVVDGEDVNLDCGPGIEIKMSPKFKLCMHGANALKKAIKEHEQEKTNLTTL